MPAKTRKSIASKEAEEAPEPAATAAIEKKLNSLAAMVDTLQSSVNSLKAQAERTDSRFQGMKARFARRVR